MKKTAVVLFNLGGPLSTEGIEPFLLSLFSDPAILPLPNPFRSLLATYVTKKRLREAKEIYAHLGGSSPLLKNTQDQAAALEAQLPSNVRVFVAMRHAPPFTEDTAERVRAYAPEEIVLLPLYPQYSHTTTGSSLKAWERATKAFSGKTHIISAYPTCEGFLEALVGLALPAYREAQTYGSPRLLMTAHGLPERAIRRGDPYQRQVEETARAFVERLGLPSLDSVLCYQSRVGPLKWIGPATDDEICRGAREGRPLVVVPLSFVSEHSETLVELDITYRELAAEKGCPHYLRVGTVQTDPSFIKGLAQRVEQAIA